MDGQTQVQEDACIYWKVRSEGGKKWEEEKGISGSMRDKGV